MALLKTRNKAIAMISHQLFKKVKSCIFDLSQRNIFSIKFENKKRIFLYVFEQLKKNVVLKSVKKIR